jgi:signal transduction histidine kinase
MCYINLRKISRIYNMDYIPVRMILLTEEDEIESFNRLFKLELNKIGVDPSTFRGDIYNFIPMFSKKMHRLKSEIVFGGINLKCTLSYHQKYIYVDDVSATETVVKYLSHELKTPITASIELLALLSATRLNEDQQKIVMALKSNSVTFTKNVNDIVDYLKITGDDMSLSKEEFLISTALEEVKKYIPVTSIDVKYDIQYDITLNMDFKRFVEVLVHIIQNSIKNTRKGYVSLKTKSMQNILTIYITDTGLKLTHKKMEIMFYGFIHSPKHIGLGMPISRGISRLMGGDLTIVSTSDYGTTYKFFLNIEDAWVDI